MENPAIFFLFIFVTVTIFELNAYVPVPGCTDLEAIKGSSDNISETSLLNLACICGPPEKSYNESERDNGISINCIYGSTLTDLFDVVQLANNVNRPIYEISITYLNSEESNYTLTDVIDQMAYDSLRKLEISRCRGKLPFQIISNIKDVERKNYSNLHTLILDGCHLTSMPTEILKRAPGLRTLSLVGNKIKLIEKSDLRQSIKLEYFNVAGNILSEVEPGALTQLQSLQALIIGEHNYASDQFKKEIGASQGLQELDMSRMDGINDNSTQIVFNEPNIRKLILVGCSLKSMDANTLHGLHHLEVLDLRTNLLERLENDTFTSTPLLKTLLLGGNYLRAVPDHMLEGMSHLEHLDLSFNDVVKVNMSTFEAEAVQKSLTYLDLRYNEKLSQLEKGSFKNLTSLQSLNMSHCALSQIPNETLSHNIKVLDISFNNISMIESGAFDFMKESLEYLDLSQNELKILDARLLVGVEKLKLLDLSGNPWICDDAMRKIKDIINERYKWSAAHSWDFELRNAANTTCDRPYSLRTVPIFDLTDEQFEYNEGEDTTLAVSQATTSTYGEDEANTTLLDWKAITILVADQSLASINDSSLFVVDDDASKPTYDINAVKYGQKNSIRYSSNNWISASIVTLLVLTTVICVILVVRHKKFDDNTDVSASKNQAVVTTTVF
ncbi:leucine rich repeat domain-containing protein [Ditylenchus destructor]|uniref:Leucine rich repeat domain-containing protein n=1 Tax=Ditylenchus destructor TaxID=166010 RepID=A0AAD4QYF2_9BILA|nr:leucine rich repeat domain-containing protein [Ditylenchus destructor]